MVSRAPSTFEAADEFGYRIKLLGIAKAHRGANGEEAHRGAGSAHPGSPRRACWPIGGWCDECRGLVDGRCRRSDPLLRCGRGGDCRLPARWLADLMELGRAVCTRACGGGRVEPLSYLSDQNLLSKRMSCPWARLQWPPVYLRFDRRWICPGVLWKNYRRVLGRQRQSASIP